MSANGVGIGRCPPDVDLHIAPDGPTQSLQRLQKRPDAGLKFRIVRGYGQEHADAPHRVLLLRKRGGRPRCGRAAEQRDEIAPADHSITSSARASNVGDTSRPSALAVLRLITNSNFVGNCTGRSAGLAPLRILPIYMPAWRYPSARLGA